MGANDDSSITDPYTLTYATLKLPENPYLTRFIKYDHERNELLVCGLNATDTDVGLYSLGIVAEVANSHYSTIVSGKIRLEIFAASELSSPNQEDPIVP